MNTTVTHYPSPPLAARILRRLAFFLLIPIFTLVFVALAAGILIRGYQQQHQDKIYTGVNAWGVDLSRMSRSQAQEKLNAQFPYANQEAIILVDPMTRQEWRRSPAQLGMAVDVAETINKAYQVGRGGGDLANLRRQFEAWYYGYQIAPTITFDEAKIDDFVGEVALSINRPPLNASLDFDGNTAGYSDGQNGRILNAGNLHQRISDALTGMRSERIALTVAEIQPDLPSANAAAARIQQIIGSPISFYLNEPLSGVDLSRAVISTQELTTWLRIEVRMDDAGAYYHHIFVDENAARSWLTQFEQPLYREPIRARFYFNDDTRQLVLVEPHIEGRALDIEATLERLMAQIDNSNRSIPFILQDITPKVHANATAEELGITELITENTTWFRNSTLERKHNIARAAANFYGIVIAPGETFSFNQYLGDISEEEGYETGLIIYGGRTIEGVGGGVCQVSTTIFQSAFWAGFPIEERWEHGYRVPYYDDGEGAGMDATVFSPIVDFRFTNNTPHHLLIENYYNEANESLTFKFYSASMGRQVVKGDVQVRNIVPPKPDVWEFNPELTPGEILQVDWAIEGSDVSISRQVLNANGETLYGTELYESQYLPWQNVFQYGPGVTPPSSQEEAAPQTDA